MTWFDMSRADAIEVLRRLADARHIALVKGTARILMAFPFSAIATPFRVLANGRTYFANCAWDAVMFHQLLGADIAIDSFCHHCAAPIRIEMRDGRATRAEPAEAIVYLARRPADWWEDIITTCSNTMVFFASPEHRDASELAASADSAASLTPDQALALGQPLYDGRALDRLRPTRPRRTDSSLRIIGPDRPLLADLSDGRIQVRCDHRRQPIRSGDRPESRGPSGQAGRSQRAPRHLGPSSTGSARPLRHRTPWRAARRSSSAPLVSPPTCQESWRRRRHCP